MGQDECQRKCSLENRSTTTKTMALCKVLLVHLPDNFCRCEYCFMLRWLYDCHRFCRCRCRYCGCCCCGGCSSLAASKVLTFVNLRTMSSRWLSEQVVFPKSTLESIPIDIVRMGGSCIPCPLRREISWQFSSTRLVPEHPLMSKSKPIFLIEESNSS